MDKLRENAFAIGVGALGLGAAILFYVLVLRPIFNQFGDTTGSAKDNLNTVNNRINRYKNKTITPVLPTREYVDAMKTYVRDLDTAQKRAVEFYDEKTLRFNDMFEEFIGIQIPALADFQAIFTTRVDNLKKAYLGAFPPPPPPDPNKPPEDILPGQDKRVFGNDAEVKEAMKQYWMLEAVFKALHQHQLGGLKSITFGAPGRGAQAETTPPQYKVMRASIKLNLPMDRVEPFLSTLHQAEKVPFELETLTIERDPESIIQDLVIQKEYEKPEEASKDRLPGAEPPISADITLRAIEWVGFPKEPDPKAKK